MDMSHKEKLVIAIRIAEAMSPDDDERSQIIAGRLAAENPTSWWAVMNWVGSLGCDWIKKDKGWWTLQTRKADVSSEAYLGMFWAMLSCVAKAIKEKVLT